jgi:hypothetical protein
LAIHSGQGERQRGDPGLLGDGETHGGQQDRRRVEAQHDRAHDRERREGQPEQHDPVAGPAGHRVGRDVEDARDLGDLGGHGDRDQEDRDGQDLLEDGMEGRGHGSG